ncbi:hypothetical protein HMPREF0762_01522 [Slackia exigua ATCC 700122]|uniref:Uncharacterized protein n=1 Tax=Slackia exigua (strain ATCC 700122 / DSM 15923 / CIP 105133 / JCM 11022 / KCTC 5966 / S-7) TaxID=649764 RepID=D0WI50_SLAES|nr:hypothetical protein HMPREF0762_01522 [Slackia exigua ATCC 700122]
MRARRDAAHVVSAAFARHDVPFGLQLAIGAFDGYHAHAEVGRQASFRRKTIVRQQIPGKDVIADMAVETFVQTQVPAIRKIVDAHGFPFLVISK